MFKRKGKNQDPGIHVSWDMDQENELIVDLKKKKKSSPSWRPNSEERSRNWSFSFRIPSLGLRIFRSKKDKDLNFISNFNRKERKSFSRRVVSLVLGLFSLFKFGARSGAVVLRQGVLFIKALFVFAGKIKRYNPFKLLPLFISLPFSGKKLASKNKKERERKSLENKEEKKDKEQLLWDEAYSSNRFFLKSLLSFFALLLLFTVPFKILDYYTSFDLAGIKSGVMNSSREAFSNFKNAAQALTDMETEEATRNFSEANMNLLRAEEQIEDINDILLNLSRFAPQEELRLASISKQILTAGQAASRLGEDLTSAFDILLKFGEDQEAPLEIVDRFQARLEDSLSNAKKINNNISEIDPDIIPEEYGDDFASLKKKGKMLENGLEEMVLLAQKSRILLGEDEYKKRYLIVFQNSNELRPTGGFMGSFAEVTFKNGELEDNRVPKGGSYDVDGGMTERITPPEPLQLVSSRWGFRDANWWPDWPTSAENLIRFYEKSGGATVDGCIAITPEVLGGLLDITGPLDMEEKYDIIIDKDNFWEIIRQQIEEKKESEEPKEIINDLTQKITDKLSRDLDKEKILKLLETIQRNLEAKDVQFYFSDKELQEEVLKRNWGGRIKQAPHDYLAVINSNIGGQKSDKSIEQSITHKADIQKDGSIVNTVTITRIHNGDEEDEKYYRSRNVNWMRVYVPEGSELLQARGFEAPGEKFFKEPPRDDQKKHPLVESQKENKRYHYPSGTEIYSESDKTVFANWSILDPGEKDIIEFKYKLPFKLFREDPEPSGWWNNIKGLFSSPSPEKHSAYSLLTQRQAGSDKSEINSVVMWPESFKPIWSYPEDISINTDNWFISRELDKDKYWGVILKK